MIAATEYLALEERTARQIKLRYEIDLVERRWSREAAALAATDY